MATGDVTIQNGGHGNVKIHPHVLALLRWCISCVWSAASELLQRLMAAPLPPIKAALKRSQHTHSLGKRWPPRKSQRQASQEHINPEPKVECVVLHEPGGEVNLDVIFVHGLYGSLGNTWRQGDWKRKYKWGPNRVPIKRQASIPTACADGAVRPPAPDIQVKIKDRDFCICDSVSRNDVENKNEANITYKNGELNGFSAKQDLNINEKEFDSEKSSIIDEQGFITDDIYGNDFMESVEIIDNYEAQAKFVRDLFRSQNDCDRGCDNIGSDPLDCEECKHDVDKQCKSGSLKRCPVGCGCVCEKCYSPCWPRDWLQLDYPDARVISINYTSDPYLWRPVWIKECKRLQLRERAEQMTRQLLDLGVGKRPIIWVGHSKGGLFIKQIYCDAFEAYASRNPNDDELNNTHHPNIKNTITPETITRGDDANDIDNNKECVNLQYSEKEIDDEKQAVDDIERDPIYNHTKLDNVNSDDEQLLIDVISEKDTTKDIELMMISDIECTKEYTIERTESVNADTKKTDGREENCDDGDAVSIDLAERACLWSNSEGFMFYSVPHRGSSLADINVAPLMLRSIELLEISKDCSLVLELHERWLKATEWRKPMVRSLVETSRTLMAILWLRIVSFESADAGLGALCGVSVDHREICKPSSRSCLLYTELLNLIHASLNRCCR